MNAPATSAAELAEAVSNFYEATQGDSGDAEIEAALDMADAAKRLLDRRLVRTADVVARLALRIRNRLHIVYLYLTLPRSQK